MASSLFLEEGRGTQACQVPGDGVQQEGGGGGSFWSMFFELDLVHRDKKNSIRSCVK